jgi:Flp pilus assembly protein protease CpaA
MNDTLLSQVVLTAWLLLCAIYDHRSRRVPNWLTLPALPLALWWAVGHSTLALTITVFVASYLAFSTGGMGGADGKIATVQAAVSPVALLATGILLAAAFLGLRLKRNPHRHLPAGLWFFAGALLSLPLSLIPTFLPGGMP